MKQDKQDLMDQIKAALIWALGLAAIFWFLVPNDRLVWRLSNAFALGSAPGLALACFRLARRWGLGDSFMYSTSKMRRVLKKDQLWVAGCLGAMAHSMGQMAVAILVSGTPGLVIYLPVMLGCSILSGGFTGLCAQVLVNRGKDLWKTSSK